VRKEKRQRPILVVTFQRKVWKGKKIKKKALYPLTMFKPMKPLLVFRTKESLKKQMKKAHKHPRERKLKVPRKQEIKIIKKVMEKWCDKKT